MKVLCPRLYMSNRLAQAEGGVSQMGSMADVESWDLSVVWGKLVPIHQTPREGEQNKQRKLTC